MIKMRKYIQWFVKALIAGTISCVILSVFVILYKYEGVHISNVDNGTDYKWEQGQWKSNMTEGFAWFSMDDNGFNNQSDDTEGIDILLMGSSHMEACQVNNNENVAALLNTGLSELKTYNIGISGHTIYRCLDNLSDAVNKYKPGKYIVIETDRINLDVGEMKKVISGSADAIPSYDSGIEYYFQKIPAIKLLYSQIDNWISSEEEIKEVHSADSADVSQNYEDILNDFISKAATEAEKGNCQLIIFYHPQTKLKEDGSLDLRTDSRYLEKFREVCEKNKVVFIDMSEEFSALYYEQHSLPYGFYNTEVGKGHLNKDGHGLIADKIERVIIDLEENE